MVDVEDTGPGRQKYPGDGAAVESRAPDGHLDIPIRHDGFNRIVCLAGVQGFRFDGGCPGVELPDIELITDPGQLAGDRLSRFPLRVSLEREHPNPVSLVHGDHRTLSWSPRRLDCGGILGRSVNSWALSPGPYGPRRGWAVSSRPDSSWRNGRWKQGGAADPGAAPAGANEQVVQSPRNRGSKTRWDDFVEERSVAARVCSGDPSGIRTLLARFDTSRGTTRTCIDRRGVPGRFEPDSFFRANPSRSAAGARTPGRRGNHVATEFAC
jgi:hypothetical protein